MSRRNKRPRRACKQSNISARTSTPLADKAAWLTVGVERAPLASLARSQNPSVEGEQADVMKSRAFDGG
eukprot:446219-Prymnesium_polylepis.2